MRVSSNPADVIDAMVAFAGLDCAMCRSKLKRPAEQVRENWIRDKPRFRGAISSICESTEWLKCDQASWHVCLNCESTIFEEMDSMTTGRWTYGHGHMDSMMWGRYWSHMIEDREWYRGSN